MYEYTIVGRLAHPINGGTDTVTLAEITMKFRRDWEPGNQETGEKLAELLMPALSPFAEGPDDMLQAHVLVAQEVTA
ncbi:hypothetical protein K8O93_01050 [Gordonia bronchialis]|uniref:hypothetical protein n=1 Tax=Gordonia bronchialis TaxID=2054 RepID=UPI001CBDEEB1|nr:hypothetical protein [Gordonia bronchialis]UAK38421.1 hypothetical protein K8O93_01050 [Gordonia bronchialis]